MDIEKKLKELNIELPNAPDPVGAYVAYKKVNNFTASRTGHPGDVIFEFKLIS